MKTMKHILLILCVTFASAAMANGDVLYQTSSTTFKSVSTSGSSSAGGVGGSASSRSSMGGFGGGAVATTVPSVSFRSTSTMPSVGSTLLNDESTEFIPMDEGENMAPRGPQRVTPDTPPADPYEPPIGDAVLPLLLLAAGYSIYLRRKNSVRTPDAGQNQ